MEEITYETKTVVRLGGKIIGEIRRSPQGFFYKVKGNKAVGETFPTLDQCKQSLEPEFHEVDTSNWQLKDENQSSWVKGQLGFGS
tara:strand:+ start:387 stop:641 length:255 start_codon:yes stop_codon:yes gene_type:complete